MQTTELKLSNLHLLSDDLAVDFQQQLEFAIKDCEQRPTDASKREVVIKLIITPHPDEADDVQIIPVTTRKTPARKLDAIRARRTPKHQIQFDFDDDEITEEKTE